MDSSLTKDRGQAMLKPVNDDLWWKSKLLYDEYTTYTLGLEEKTVDFQGKRFHLPCIKLGQEFSDEVEFKDQKISLIAAFNIFDGNVLEPISFENCTKDSLAFRVHIAYDIIYIVQEKKGINAKEKTIIRN